MLRSNYLSYYSLRCVEVGNYTRVTSRFPNVVSSSITHHRSPTSSRLKRTNTREDPSRGDPSAVEQLQD